MSSHYNEMECSLCGKDIFVPGNWHGDGWFDEREFEPFDDPVLCKRCKDGEVYTVTLEVVGYDDFDKWDNAEWSSLFADCDGAQVLSSGAKRHGTK
jgi:hypothetical protein